MTINPIGAGVVVFPPQAGIVELGVQKVTLSAARSSAPIANSNVSLSSQSLAASDLLEAANRFVQNEHLEPFGGYDNGNVSPSGYLNVNKYNSYVIDKAASNMVDGASKLGITLNKDDVVKSLNASNPNVVSIVSNEADRQSKLGQASVLSDLSGSDMNKLTDIYIQAKEKGLDTDQVEVLAARMGLAARDQKNGVTTYIYDPEKEKTGYGNSTIVTNADATTFSSINELTTAGIKSLGISDAALLKLVQSASSGSDDAGKTINFIRSLLSVK